MWIWAVATVSGVCAALSLRMAYLACRLGDGGAYLFFAFGLLFGIAFVVSALRLAAGKRASSERADEGMSGRQGQVSFVPHRFLMAALILTGIVILAGVLVPLLFR